MELIDFFWGGSCGSNSAKVDIFCGDQAKNQFLDVFRS